MTKYKIPFIVIILILFILLSAFFIYDIKQKDIRRVQAVNVVKFGIYKNVDDIQTAIDNLVYLAKRKDNEAIFWLGLTLYCGGNKYDIKRDSKQAIFWLEQCDTAACVSLFREIRAAGEVPKSSGWCGGNNL